MLLIIIVIHIMLQITIRFLLCTGRFPIIAGCWEAAAA